MKSIRMLLLKVTCMGEHYDVIALRFPLMTCS